MSLSFGQSKSKNKPVIEQAAITPEQRQQLFPQVGNLLGFNFSSQGGFTPQNVTQQFGQIPMEGVNRYQSMLQSAMSNPYTPTSGEDINALLGQRQQELAGLLQFLEQMGFRRNLGQQGSASAFNGGVGLPTSWTGGGGGGGVTTG